MFERKKMHFMAVILIFYIVISILFATNVFASESDKTGSIGNVTYKLESSPKKPTVNTEMTYKLSLTDSQNGKPVNSAEIMLKAYMEKKEASSGGHEGMSETGGQDQTSAIEDKFVSTGKNGEYEAKIKFNMEDDWTISIEGTADNQPLTFNLNEMVAKEASGNPNWVVIGGFLALIVATGTIFANKKRTKASDGQNTMSPTDIPTENEA